MREANGLEKYQDEKEPSSQEGKLEIRYELEQPPSWYIQGSYVLDKIFTKNFARDVDIFIAEGSTAPPIEDDRFIHKIELQEDTYFPPPLGCYNTDRYLLTEKGVIAPQGFPKIPEKLELLGGTSMTVVDVIRGLKTSQRYNLSPQESVREAWKKALERAFDPEWMKVMLFESEQEVIEYFLDILKDETSEKERESVTREIERIIGKKMI